MYSAFNIGARWRWVVNAMLRPLYPRENPVRIVQEAGCATKPVWTSAENLAPLGFGLWTIQAVATRFTDWDFPANNHDMYV